MLRSILILALLAVAPAYAQSADEEARLSAATRAMEAQTFAFYVAVDPRFAALLAPEAVEDPIFAQNRRCFLDRLAAEGGPQMPEAYIAALEVQGATEITSLLSLGAALPEVLTSELVFVAADACGALSHATRQMATPEFMELMEEPEVMQRLMGG